MCNTHPGEAVGASPPGPPASGLHHWSPFSSLSLKPDLGPVRARLGAYRRRPPLLWGHLRRGAHGPRGSRCMRTLPDLANGRPEHDWKRLLGSLRVLPPGQGSECRKASLLAGLSGTSGIPLVDGRSLRPTCLGGWRVRFGTWHFATPPTPVSTFRQDGAAGVAYKFCRSL